MSWLSRFYSDYVPPLQKRKEKSSEEIEMDFWENQKLARRDKSSMNNETFRNSLEYWMSLHADLTGKVVDHDWLDQCIEGTRGLEEFLDFYGLARFALVIGFVRERLYVAAADELFGSFLFGKVTDQILSSVIMRTSAWILKLMLGFCASWYIIEELLGNPSYGTILTILFNNILEPKKLVISLLLAIGHSYLPTDLLERIANSGLNIAELGETVGVFASGTSDYLRNMTLVEFLIKWTPIDYIHSLLKHGMNTINSLPDRTYWFIMLYLEKSIGEKWPKLQKIFRKPPPGSYDYKGLGFFSKFHLVNTNSCINVGVNLIKSFTIYIGYNFVEEALNKWIGYGSSTETGPLGLLCSFTLHALLNAIFGNKYWGQKTIFMAAILNNIEMIDPRYALAKIINLFGIYFTVLENNGYQYPKTAEEEYYNAKLLEGSITSRTTSWERWLNDIPVTGDSMKLATRLITGSVIEKQSSLEMAKTFSKLLFGKELDLDNPTTLAIEMKKMFKASGKLIGLESHDNLPSQFMCDQSSRVLDKMIIDIMTSPNMRGHFLREFQIDFGLDNKINTAKVIIQKLLREDINANDKLIPSLKIDDERILNNEDVRRENERMRIMESELERKAMIRLAHANLDKVTILHELGIMMSVPDVTNVTFRISAHTEAPNLIEDLKKVSPYIQQASPEIITEITGVILSSRPKSYKVEGGVGVKSLSNFLQWVVTSSALCTMTTEFRRQFLLDASNTNQIYEPNANYSENVRETFNALTERSAVLQKAAIFDTSTGMDIDMNHQILGITDLYASREVSERSQIVSKQSLVDMQRKLLENTILLDEIITSYNVIDAEFRLLQKSDKRIHLELSYVEPFRNIRQMIFKEYHDILTQKGYWDDPDKITYLKNVKDSLYAFEKELKSLSRSSFTEEQLKNEQAMSANNDSVISEGEKIREYIEIMQNLMEIVELSNSAKGKNVARYKALPTNSNINSLVQISQGLINPQKLVVTAENLKNIEELIETTKDIFMKQEQRENTFVNPILSTNAQLYDVIMKKLDELKKKSTSYYTKGIIEDVKFDIGEYYPMLESDIPEHLEYLRRDALGGQTFGKLQTDLDTFNKFKTIVDVVNSITDSEIDIPETIRQVSKKYENQKGIVNWFLTKVNLKKEDKSRHAVYFQKMKAVGEGRKLAFLKLLAEAYIKVYQAAGIDKEIMESVRDLIAELVPMEEMNYIIAWQEQMSKWNAGKNEKLAKPEIPPPNLRGQTGISGDSFDYFNGGFARKKKPNEVTKDNPLPVNQPQKPIITKRDKTPEKVTPIVTKRDKTPEKKSISIIPPSPIIEETKEVTITKGIPITSLGDFIGNYNKNFLKLPMKNYLKPLDKILTDADIHTIESNFKELSDSITKDFNKLRITPSQLSRNIDVQTREFHVFDKNSKYDVTKLELLKSTHHLIPNIDEELFRWASLGQSEFHETLKIFKKPHSRTVSLNPYIIEMNVNEGYVVRPDLKTIGAKSKIKQFRRDIRLDIYSQIRFSRLSNTTLNLLKKVLDDLNMILSPQIPLPSISDQLEENPNIQILDQTLKIENGHKTWMNLDDKSFAKNRY